MSAHLFRFAIAAAGLGVMIASIVLWPKIIAWVMVTGPIAVILWSATK